MKRIVTPPCHVLARRRGTARLARCRRLCQAFTIFELTLTMTILAIVGLIVVPIMVNAGTAPGLRTAANLLAADLEFCQSQCISGPNAPCLVRFDVANNRYWIALASNPTVPITHPADGLPYINDFATGRTRWLRGVTLASVSSGTSLSFDAYGKPQASSDVTVTLSAGGGSAIVRVNQATGDVTLDP